MLILIAHGSRDPRWRESLERLTVGVRSGSESTSPGSYSTEVELAFMQFDEPTLPKVVEEGWNRGTRHFKLLPLFMASAGHVEKHIQPMVKDLERSFPQGQFQLLTPVGENPHFQDLIQNIATDENN